jgi:hypothetical protein
MKSSGSRQHRLVGGVSAAAGGGWKASSFRAATIFVRDTDGEHAKVPRIRRRETPRGWIGFQDASVSR